jgi:hypothetical protein
MKVIISSPRIMYAEVKLKNQSIDWGRLTCRQHVPVVCNLTSTNGHWYFLLTPARVVYQLPKGNGSLTIDNFWCPIDAVERVEQVERIERRVRKTLVEQVDVAGTNPIFIVVFCALLSLLVGLIIYFTIKRQRRGTKYDSLSLLPV